MSNAERDETSPFSLHQAFPSKQELADATKIHAAKAGFEFYAHKSDNKKYDIRCRKAKDQKCPWRLYASPSTTSPGFIIKTLDLRHTCTAMNRLTSRNMTSTLAARMIQPKVADHPKYKPKEVQQDLLRMEGLGLSYGQAHRAKRKATEALYGNFAGSFGMIAQYCDILQDINFNSVATWDADEATDMFHRTFISFGASIAGFVSCRPVIGLDGTHLRHSYKGESRLLYVV